MVRKKFTYELLKFLKLKFNFFYQKFVLKFMFSIVYFPVILNMTNIEQI